MSYEIDTRTKQTNALQIVSTNPFKSSSVLNLCKLKVSNALPVAAMALMSTVAVYVLDTVYLLLLIIHRQGCATDLFGMVKQALNSCSGCRRAVREMVTVRQTHMTPVPALRV